jgi:hypothetical protein
LNLRTWVPKVTNSVGNLIV